MDRKLPKYSDAVRTLMAMTDEVVPASAIAPILGIHPQVMIRQAKDGTWSRDVCNYIVSGRCVKFFRIDFLRKGGWI
jgi:hypothetical protein